MDEDQYFKLLSGNLLKRGFPLRSVRRIIEELRDHAKQVYLELLTNSMEAGDRRKTIQERLGDPYFLADFYYREAVSRSLWGKFPVVCFVVFSIAMFFVKSAIVLLAAFVLNDFFPSGFHTTGVFSALHICNGALKHLPLILNITILMICFRMSRNYCLTVKWALFAGVVLSVLSFFGGFSYAIVSNTPVSVFTIAFTMSTEIRSLGYYMNSIVLLVIGIGIWFFLDRLNVYRGKRYLKRS